MDSDGVTMVPEQLATGNSYVFSDLAWQEYILTIADPYFNGWTGIVRPGAAIPVSLEGASSIALEVWNRDEQITDFQATIRLRNTTVVTGALSATNEVLSQLIPGDYRLIVVSASSIGAVDVDGLGLRERRTVAVKLGQSGAINGRVEYSDGLPAGRIGVALLDGSAFVDLSADHMMTAERALFDDNTESSITTMAGEFSFAVPRAGRYRVCAWGPDRTESVSKELELDQSAISEIKLILPRGGLVTGTILSPEGASCEGLGLWFGPFGARPTDPPGFFLNLGSRGVCSIETDCRFESGLVPPGLSSVYLLLSRRGQDIERMNGVLLGTVNVIDQATVREDFTVLEFPGTVAVCVQTNGEAAQGVKINLSMAVGRERYLAQGTTDESGCVGPIPVFPGVWRITVHHAHEGWHYEDPQPIIVESIKAATATIHLQVAEGTLALLDAVSGEPLAGRWIALESPHQKGRKSVFVRRKTDSQGRMTLRLISGTYRIRLEPIEGIYAEGLRDQHCTEVIWTLDGPLESSVHL